MRELTGLQILGVESRPTKTGGTQWLIKLSNGTSPSTFAQEAAGEAQRLVGQVVDVQLEDKPSGDGTRVFTNYISARPSAAGTPPPEIQEAPSAPNLYPSSSYNRQTNPIDAERMTRSASLSTAFNYTGQIYGARGGSSVEDLIAAENYAFALAGRIKDFVYADAPKPSEGLTEPPRATQESVAAQVNEVLGEAVVTTGPRW